MQNSLVFGQQSMVSCVKPSCPHWDRQRTNQVLNLCEGVNKKHFHNKKTRLRRATETALLSKERQTERQKSLIKAGNSIKIKVSQIHLRPKMSAKF